MKEPSLPSEVLGFFAHDGSGVRGVWLGWPSAWQRACERVDECRFKLTLDAGDECDVAQLVISDHGQAVEPCAPIKGY
jgi:bisphosphoglycerate-independent phosphoglycerate mutase (AlkP superfamily)